MLHWLANAERLCGQVAGSGSTYEQQALFVVRLANGYTPEASNDVNWDRFKSTILDSKFLPIDDVVARCAKLEEERGGFGGVAESIARNVGQHVSAVQLAMIPLMAGLRT